MYESFSSIWNAKQWPFDSRHPAVFGTLKLIKLAFFGSLFIASYLSSWAFSIVHKFGMALTSPDKSRRYWFREGLILSQTTFLGYTPGSSYILPYLFSLFSIAFSTLAWAVTFPLAVSAVTTFFPAVIPFVNSLANLPFIASTVTMISTKLITLSSTVTSIFSPAIAVISAIAATVGVHITATSFAVGSILGAIAAFSSIVLTYIADKTSNRWATFKGADTYELLKEDIELARVKARDIEETLEEVKQGINTFDNDFIDVVVKTIFDPQYSAKLEECCSLAAEAIKTFIKSKSEDDGNRFAAAIEQKIYSHRDKPEFKKNLKIFEIQLKNVFNTYLEKENANSNWKDIIYGGSTSKALSAHATELQVNFNSETPIDKSSRQKESSINGGDFTDPDSNIVAATTGTTFFTNSLQVLARSEKSALDSNLSVTHVMDSCLVAHRSYQYNATRKINLAMADGLGGHTGDKAKDTRVSRASYFGCKHAIRLCSTYYDPDALKANLKTIIQNVGAEILIKNNGSRESTSLTCANVFPISGGWSQPLKQRVIGANIGGSMLVAWNPKTQTITTLLPGRQLVQNAAQGPVLPSNYTVETDLDIVDVTLDQGTVLIPFTKGMLGSFNTITKQETKNDKNYNMVEINPEWIVPILRTLNPNASAKTIVNTLMQHVMDQAEKDRSALVQQSETAKAVLAELMETQKTDRDDLNVKISELEAKTQINYGDDITVMAVRLQ
ncbi:MAG: hypothetical protein K2X50_04595 [Gammaproteobacteria bacterium]|nr:hypothetical protein [Gammaproteobacteria bacterium]